MQILLCDDHPIVLIANRALLEAYGHTVVAAVPHHSALPELVLAHRPDACVLDLHFEDDASLDEVCATIATVARHTDVVVLTGLSVGQVGSRATDAGASAVVSKAAPSEDLVATVEGRLASRPISAATPARRATRFGLTERELQVLLQLAEGESTERISARLGLRTTTTRSHIQNLIQKLAVHSRQEAVALAISEGIIVRTAGNGLSRTA